MKYHIVCTIVSNGLGEGRKKIQTHIVNNSRRDRSQHDTMLAAGDWDKGNVGYGCPLFCSIDSFQNNKLEKIK